MKYWMMLLALAAFTQAHADNSAQKILSCIQSNVPSSTQIEDIELSSSDPAGTTRTLSGKIYALRKDKNNIQVMLRIKGPEPYAGAAYLIRKNAVANQSSMFVYLPSVNRVRRITGSFVDGSLMGTNFSYQDFQQLTTAFAGSSATLEPAAVVEDRPVYVLSFKPAADSHSRFNLIRTWVDQKTCVPIKASFYAGKNLLKTLTASPAALRQSGSYWYLSQMEMHDLKDGTQTVLSVSQVTEGASVGHHYFEPGSFYQAN